MTIQQTRRRDPYPWTWEIPLLTLLFLAVVLAAGVQAGRTIANLLAGHGWTWPADRAEFWQSISAIVTGDSDAGLPAAQANGDTSSTVLWASVGAVETSILLASAAATVYVLRRWGPTRLKGMATRTEAEALLGIARLRRVAPIVRPDLHGARVTGRKPGRKPSRPAS